MKPRRCLTLLLFVLLTASAFVAQEMGERPETINLDIYYRHDPWIMSPPVMDGTDFTRSIFYSVLRAVEPRTGQPYDETQPIFPCAAEDIRHSFRLEKKEFLLGEPILIEHRIELEGAGTWRWEIGGNYRARGRDDNYFCVLRSADGSIVPDTEAPPSFLMGGLSGSHEITADKPFSYWLALQRYSTITRPGSYDLYCLTGHKNFLYGDAVARKAEADDKLPTDHYINENGFLIDSTTGQNSKRYDYGVNLHYLDKSPPPLLDLLPSDVVAYAKEHSVGLPNTDGYGIGVVGHFKIRIRKGSDLEQQRMVKRWTKAAEPIDTTPVMGDYNAALLDAIWYASQSHFLPLLEKWITSYKESEDSTPFDFPQLDLNGLAMRPDPAAFALLLKSPPKQAVNAFHHLSPDRITEAIPICINWLTHPDNDVRAMAEFCLTTWTGQSFGHTWSGYHYQRPTLAEGLSMQRLWRAWWEKSKRGFKPLKPCLFPCKRTESQNNEAR